MDGTRWVTSKHPTNPHYKKHYLTDVEQLSELFRKKFTRGLKRLHRKGEIDYTPPPLPDEDDPRSVGYQETFAEWADRTGDRDWCVHIEPPPQNSTPEHALKYLARYLNGGPISDGRLISHEDRDVTFWARNRRGKSRPFKLSGTEFVRRWSLHISPPGLTRSRPYGGFSYQSRGKYLDLCRKLLPPPPPPANESPSSSGEQVVAEEAEPPKLCPRCESPMDRIELGNRPGWRHVFDNNKFCPWWYSHHPTSRSRPRIRGPD